MPLLLIVVVVAIVFLSGFRIAQEYQRGVVFRLGRFQGLRGPGLFWIVPIGIERAVIIDIRTRTVSAERQETITRDSVTISVNAVLWYRVVDAAKSVIAVSDASAAVYQANTWASSRRGRILPRPEWAPHVWIRAIKKGTITGERFSYEAYRRYHRGCRRVERAAGCSGE